MAQTPKRPPKLMIGWRETLFLPQWDLPPLKAKADTGARTTALHASGIEEFRQDGALYVRFCLDHPDFGPARDLTCKVMHRREITNTSGVPDLRYIIAAHVEIGPRKGRIEISLANRADMAFPIILGRTAMRVLRLTVDPTRSWLQSEKPRQTSNHV